MQKPRFTARLGIIPLRELLKALQSQYASPSLTMSRSQIYRFPEYSA
jgi:hypothetical protein